MYERRVWIETGLQAIAENRKWRRGSDSLWQSVPHSDREGSVSDGWETCSADTQRCRRGTAKLMSSLGVGWLMQLVSKVRRCSPVQTLYTRGWTRSASAANYGAPAKNCRAKKGDSTEIYAKFSRPGKEF